MFRRLLIATIVGILAAFAVAAFRHAMLLLEWLFLNNDSGSLVNAATNLSPWRRLLTPALGGLIVGLLSLFTPAVWGNGYSTVQSFLTAPPLFMIIGGIFLCKLFAVLASSGSGAPGGVFTPTLFIGLAIGMLYGRSLGLWFPDGEEITLLLGLTGMATLLAATTHAPIMSTLMICEMTGEYQLLPGLLIACVIASVISRTLHRDSIYRQHTAQHS
ncbi:hypothetical protein ERU12_07005 [Escherichia coli]|nr:hypothetical protein [Escherichia coli]